MAGAGQVRVEPSRSARHVDDGDIVLSNGRTTLLSDIPGGAWTRQKLRRLTNAVQNDADERVTIASLPADDPDRFEHEADPVNAAAILLAEYGERMFYDGLDLVSRTDVFTFSLNPRGDVQPHQRVLRQKRR
jgi:hypothetical protein